MEPMLTLLLTSQVEMNWKRELKLKQTFFRRAFSRGRRASMHASVSRLRGIHVFVHRITARCHLQRWQKAAVSWMSEQKAAGSIMNSIQLTHANTHAYTRTHARTHTHKQTNTHTHQHTYAALKNVDRHRRRRSYV